MTFKDWAEQTVENVRREGVYDGASESAYQLYLGALRQGYRTFYRRDEPSIFDRDWDLLVILDACRNDFIEGLEEEYDFLSSNRRFRSRGTTSEEWMRRNFTPEYTRQMTETAYVSANIFTDTYADPNRFLALDEVWRYAWNESRGTVLAESVTDRAISVYRERDPSRLLVHYMQPHAPSVPRPVGEGMIADPHSPETWASAPTLLRKGQLDRREVFDSYRENLRYVLDEVEVLLDNVDAELAVITADHGEAFGEWGVYDHTHHMPLDVLRTVPWYETDASDERTYEPSLEPSEESGDRSEKLRSLGYL